MTNEYRFKGDNERYVPSEETQAKFMNEMLLRARNDMVVKIIHTLEEVDNTYHEDMNILLEAICGIAVYLKLHHDTDSTPEGIASLKEVLVSALAACFDCHFEGFGESND